MQIAWNRGSSEQRTVNSERVDAAFLKERFHGSDERQQIEGNRRSGCGDYSGGQWLVDLVVLRPCGFGEQARGILFHDGRREDVVRG